jgi:hypothetical protein
MPGRAMLNILRSLVGAARSFFKTQKSLALENLALRHQVGVLKRTAAASPSIQQLAGCNCNGYEIPSLSLAQRRSFSCLRQWPGRTIPGR